MNAIILNLLFKSMKGWTFLYRSKPIIFSTLSYLIVSGTCVSIAEFTGLNDYFREKKKDSEQLDKEIDEKLKQMFKEASEEEMKRIEKDLK